MALIALSCPHCGGSFSLDSSQSLQTTWTCPYCGNRSLMHKSGETIRLRGIIGSQNTRKTAPLSDTEPVWTAADPVDNRLSRPDAGPLPRPVWPPPAPVTQPPVRADEPGTAHEYAGPDTDEGPIIPDKTSQSKTLSDYIAEVSEPEPDVPRTPDVPVIGTVHAGQPERQTADSRLARPATLRPCKPIETAGQEEQNQDERVSPVRNLADQAEAAAMARQLPQFNSYSRQALDHKPEEGRIYAWRARLIEEAGGMARATWASPIWYLYTPRQKEALLAQHFYAYNQAIRFSNDQQRRDLASQIGHLIVSQAVGHLTERAELRCARRLAGRTFKGRYHRKDLREATDFCDAVSRIDDTVCPNSSHLLQQAIRREAASQTRRLAKYLTRF